MPGLNTDFKTFRYKKQQFEWTSEINQNYLQFEPILIEDNRPLSDADFLGCRRVGIIGVEKRDNMFSLGVTEINLPSTTYSSITIK
ncbi:hypothetical protein [Bacillus stratosphericus]|uniref:hypothetical protein n=1 Tax=Bacillus stratosphericus TaxID=293386 RepID=UPI001CFB284F|nr:hypothetical protein [Bacillus stratosphericus]